MLLFVLFSLFYFSPSLSLKICSFNVRSFGEAKIARPEVVDVVVKVRSFAWGIQMWSFAGASYPLNLALHLFILEFQVKE